MAMDGKDYYKTIGVARGASQDEIKKAYRKLARKFHPDLNPGNKASESKFKEINEAYDVLGDPKKRADYDNPVRMAFGGGPGGPGGPGGFGGFTDRKNSTSFDFGNLGEMFSDIFGLGGKTSFKGSPGGKPGFTGWNTFEGSNPFEGHGSSDAGRRGTDLHTSLTLTLAEACTGVTKPMSVKRETPCKSCSGTGKKGSTICGECSGTGAVSMNETLKVKIPPGVDTGSKVRLKGKGAAGGGIAGDIVIEITVKPHPFFKRKGDDLYLEVPITFVEATLGTRIEIPTMDGSTIMTIPEGTQSGKAFKLKGKGMANPQGNGKGDLYVELHVAVPTGINEDAKILVSKLARLYPEDPRKGMVNNGQKE
ncbi:MAG: DnaJ domain-containing protein [Nitrospirae bacterium]|nr:DnaJ domain-containing protein [Nitrospirota bacterium]